MGILPSKEATILTQEGKMTESWYEPLGTESLQRMEKLAYGTDRKQSFMQATHRDSFGREIYKFEDESVSMSQKCGGKILIFEQNSVDIPTDAYETAEERTKLLLSDEKPITARALFKVPPCYIPVGEQTLESEDDELFVLASILGNKNKVLVGEVPKVFALFVSVDGKPVVLEKTSRECHDHMDRQYLKSYIHEDPIPGSFVCWQPVEYSWQTLFVDIPIVGGLEDVEETKDTGVHGLSCVSAFIELFSTLSPGTHDIAMELCYYFDHTRFTRMKISSFNVDDGFWEEGYYAAERFKSRHPKLGQLESCKVPVAKGLFTVEIKAEILSSISEMIDLKVPPEMYKENDVDIMRKHVYDAYDKFHYFMDDVFPDPDHVVLASALKEYSYTKQEGIHDLRKTYKFVEVTLLWLNGNDPEAYGKMLDEVMLRTDDSDSPPGAAAYWVMAKRRCVIDLHVKRVKNKYIKRSAKITTGQEDDAETKDNATDTIVSKEKALCDMGDEGNKAVTKDEGDSDETRTVVQQTGNIGDNQVTDSEVFAHDDDEVNEVKVQGHDDENEVKVQGDDDVNEVKAQRGDDVNEVKVQGDDDVNEVKVQGDDDVNEVKVQGGDDVIEVKVQLGDDVNEVKLHEADAVNEVKVQGDDDVIEIKVHEADPIKEDEVQGDDDVNEVRVQGDDEVNVVKVQDNETPGLREDDACDNNKRDSIALGDCRGNDDSVTKH